MRNFGINGSAGYEHQGNDRLVSLNECFMVIGHK